MCVSKARLGERLGNQVSSSRTKVVEARGRSCLRPSDGEGLFPLQRWRDSAEMVEAKTLSHTNGAGIVSRTVAESVPSQSFFSFTVLPGKTLR